MDKKNNQTKVDRELFSALKRWDEEAVVSAIDAGADVNGVDEYGGSRPLHLAISEKLVETARLLLERGADVHSVDGQGWPPALRAVEGWGHPVAEGDFESLSTLIEFGCDINAKAGEGSTALHLAAGSDKLEFCLFLLNHGADIEARQVSGATPLDVASMHGHLFPALALIAHGAKKDSSRPGDEHLRKALLLNELQASVVLSLGSKVLEHLEAGIDPADRGQHTQSAIEMAGRQGPAEMLGIIRSYLARGIANSALESIDSCSRPNN